jgi:DNA repair protein RadA/Sms
MARTKTSFRCTACGRQELKWLGQCQGCGEWNTLVEVEAAPAPRAGARASAREPARPISAREVQAPREARFSTGLGELDRVLGGGLVPGSSVLLGGDPGIGKSTLMLQLCAGMARPGAPVLYATGEESLEQVRARAVRLGLPLDGLQLLAETDVEALVGALREGSYRAVVFDSVQTLRCPDIPSAPGSVGQVRESAARLAEVARERGQPIFLIGQVTKEGTLAGPRMLEHMVDTVLYFEADPGRSLRVVRAHKNRFGPVSEIGVFEMTGQGLVVVDNPSRAFLQDRPERACGSAVLAMLRGTRPLLVEVQALVSSSVYAQPRRTAWGCDPNRVALLAAVLERRAGLQLAGCDLFLNVAGGLELDEPAADLAICAAILSSQVDRPIHPRLVVFGEVGLAGEVRAVPAAEARAQEAQRLGYRRLLLPAGCLEPLRALPGLEPIGIASLDRLAELALEEK